MCDQNQTDAPDAARGSRMRESLRVAESLREDLNTKARDYAQQQTGCAVPARLRERVNAAFYHAENQARRCDRLKELVELLDSNPATARILELIEQTGV